MSYEFKLPDVGEGIHEAVVVKWLVAVGDSVKEDQPFVAVETDKAVVELPAPVSSKVASLHFQPGDLVHVGDVLITFGEPGEAGRDNPSVSRKSESATPEHQKPVLERIPSEPVSGPMPSSASDAGKEEAGQQAKRYRPLATPHTRALARRLGIDLTSVKPTGKGGRVTNSDVEKIAEQAGRPGRDSHTALSDQSTIASKVTGKSVPDLPELTPETPMPSQPVMSGVLQDTEFGPVERVKISRLRQIIARNMSSSKHTLAHVTHVDEADVTDLVSLYQKVKNQTETAHGVKFTIMPFFIKAVVASLRKFPVLNASFDEETQELILKKYFHIGFAADTPEGLMVPVIHYADRKDMIRLAVEIADKAGRAKERTLTLDELQGAGFTITNVGKMGGVFATPVIPLPQLAILGMHAIKERPVVKDGEIVIRKMMNLSITFDHRMIDGMAAASFLQEVISLIENPEMLMLRLV